MKKYHKEYSPGSCQYQGDYYQLDVTKQDKDKIFAVHLFFTTAQFCLLIFAGLLNNAGSRNFFIAVPYAFIFFPTAYLSMSVYSFRRLSKQMESVVYDKAFGRSGRCLMASILISLYITIADLVWMLQFDQGEKTTEIVYLSAIFLVMISSLTHRKYLQNWNKKVIICKKET